MRRDRSSCGHPRRSSRPNEPRGTRRSPPPSPGTD
jgi:hypothetical protein